MVKRRRLHLGLPGIGYIFVSVLLGLGAVNSQNNLLFWAFGVAIVGLLLSGLISGAMLMRVEAVREEVESSSVGRPLRIRYALHNRARLLPAFAITIEELTGKGRKGSTWAAHMPLPRGYAAHIAPRRTVHAVAGVRPTRRGEAVFDAFRIVSGFPFGLFLKSVTFIDDPRAGARALVRPEVRPVRHGVVRELVRIAGEGATNTDSLGRGDEFFGLREYAPGDSPRHIAWRSTARTGELVVREHVAPSPTRVWVGLALRSDDDTRRERAISMAASLLVAAHREGVETGLHIISEGVRIPARTGARHLGAMLDALALIGADRPPTPRRMARHDAPKGAWVIVHDDEPTRAIASPDARHVTALRPGEVFMDDHPDTEGAS
ncbi:MAG: DUF58 domain-containing protein [Phycisphaerales bacterium]|nr:MAG: DUF58 domain-containing protein [Phycisphaerales bacterium]